MLTLKKKKSVIGLDIGSKSTEIVQLQFKAGEKPRLTRCDYIETGTKDPDFQNAIKSFIKENKLTSAMIASSFDDPSMKIRKMELPKMPEADLIEAIRWNLRDIVDGDIEEFTVSYSRIKEHADVEMPKIELMAYAVKREAVDNYKAQIEGLGLSPFFIEPAAVTLAATLERFAQDDERYIGGVHIGNAMTFFYVIGQGVFVFSRPMIGISLEEYVKDMDGFNQKLAIEIQKSIDTFKVNFAMQDVSKLYISGGGALIPGLIDYLNKNLGVGTEKFNPFAAFSNAEAFEHVEPALFVQALGLAFVQV